MARRPTYTAGGPNDELKPKISAGVRQVPTKIYFVSWSQSKFDDVDKLRLV